MDDLDPTGAVVAVKDGIRFPTRFLPHGTRARVLGRQWISSEAAADAVVAAARLGPSRRTR